MTLKQRALLEVAKTFTLALVVGGGTGILLNTVPLAILGIGACTRSEEHTSELQSH